MRHRERAHAVRFDRRAPALLAHHMHSGYRQIRLVAEEWNSPFLSRVVMFQATVPGVRD
jgi:hypothetical protein